MPFKKSVRLEIFIILLMKITLVATVGVSAKYVEMLFLNIFNST